MEDIELQEFSKHLNNMYGNKKIVVLYGNCHTTAMAEIMQKCETFLKEYALYPIKPIHLIESPEYFEHPIFKCCDVFIHQSIRVQNRYGEAFASEYVTRLLKDDCKVIAVPNVYHMPICFFPQYSSEKEFALRKRQTIFFRDSVIDRLFREGRDKGYIEKRYGRTDLFGMSEMNAAFDTFIKKLYERENDWDIKIADFILENYKTEQLFFDPNHPSPFLIKNIVKRLFEYMNIGGQEEIDKLHVSRMDSYEMPICQAVKENFGMRFEKQEIRIENGRMIKNEHMYLQEYISQYIALEWQNSQLPIRLRMKSFWYYLPYLKVRVCNKILRVLIKGRKL